MSPDEQGRAIAALMDAAINMGLHGIMILSPQCPGCKQAHQFMIVSDIPGTENVTALMDHMADTLERPDGPAPVHFSHTRPEERN